MHAPSRLQLRVLLLQVGILVVCGVLLALWARHFPAPSPAVARLLPPRARWPSDQVRDWALQGDGDPAFLAFFARDPERTPPGGTNIVAPADGLVRSMACRDGLRYVVIALSYWDVHLQRSPCDGVVQLVGEHGDTFMDGEGVDFAFLREKVAPVQKVVTMQTAWGALTLRLITSISARRIELWVEPGQQVAKGQRLGRFLLGSTVVLELPEDLEVAVAVGERVVAGETILVAGDSP